MHLLNGRDYCRISSKHLGFSSFGTVLQRLCLYWLSQLGQLFGPLVGLRFLAYQSRFSGRRAL